MKFEVRGIRGRWELFILFLVLLWPVLALALSPAQVFEKVKNSVVVVKAYDQRGRLVGLGSGVALSSKMVITNHHVVKEGVRLTVGQGKQASPAFVAAAEPERDLALLKVFGLSAVPASLGRARSLRVGDRVFAVGAPYGLELSMSEGLVSQLRGGPPPLIQTTAAISKGSSGGGLFNDRGELVGITTFYLEGGQGLNFAVPAEWAAQLLRAPKRAPARDLAATPPGPGKKPGLWWLARAAALEKARNWPGLLEHCRNWVRAEPKNSTAWFVLGEAYGELGRHREEVEACREALRLQPDYAKAWYNLGVAYGELGRPREAVEAYREALRLQPDFAKAWNNLAVAYALTGNKSAALQAIRELRRYDPKQADKLFDLIMGR
ncbi:MAG: trypsin-like peptidase domain-containing protein [Deltaproteobacteria bacterium]|nr:trypsin-like peptidase domain-containing protein [Deltaproteobacteria bacterium]